MTAALLLLAMLAGPPQAFPEPPAGPCERCMLGLWEMTATLPDLANCGYVGVVNAS